MCESPPSARCRGRSATTRESAWRWLTGILSSLLSGVGYGLGTGNMVDGAVPGADGQFFLAFDVEAFEDIRKFKSRVDAIVRQMRSGRRAPFRCCHSQRMEATTESIDMSFFLLRSNLGPVH